MKSRLVVVLVLVVGCKQNAPNATEAVVQKEVWTEYHSVDSIPPFIIQELKYHIADSPLFANPNEAFEAGDATLIGFNDKIPRRQLRYLGHCTNIWQLTYKHGGVGLHYHFIQSHFNNWDSTYSFIIGSSAVDLDTRNQIDSAQENDKMGFIKIDGKSDYRTTKNTNIEL